MKKRDNKKILLILLLLIIGISIGYAALATTLNINGNTTIEKASWDIHFENLVKTTGSETATVDASIDDTKTLIEYTVTLPNPGDYYEFTVDIVNNGTIDAMISEVLKEGLTTEQEKYIEYSAEYSGGVELQEKDILTAGEKDNIRVRVKYRDDITATDLPTDDTTLNLKFQVTYIQADESAVERTKFVCRRATELHTEECTAACQGAGYVNRDKIEYGNLGTKGEELVSGDAFDCDVNNDGIYDSETERFYYVSALYNTTKKEFDNNYAVLIYYNNTINGEPNNTTAVAYDETHGGDVGENWHGPLTAVTHMPTIEQWSNVNLLSINRAILNEQGGGTTYNEYNLLPTSFSYTKNGTNLAARLLTTQELENGCGITIGSNKVGELDSKCEYMLENTIYGDGTLKYGFWLENPHRLSSDNSWSVNSSARLVAHTFLFNASNWTVRPAIEVPKSNILY